MSLKAKIEAVIYASEEPVTLAQLVSLLGEEGQAELDTLAAQPRATQQPLALGEDSSLNEGPDLSEDPSPNEDELNAEVFDTSEVASAPSETPVILSEDSPGESQSKDPDPAGHPTAAEALSTTESTSADKKAAQLAARALREHFRLLLTQLVADYATSDRGLEVREVAGGYRLATKPEYHDAVRGFVKSLTPPLKLSLQALETLAVIAYKQPATAPEISEIRGVDSSGVLGSLLARKLVTTAGRKQVIGRPILYKTTKDFLLRFGLKDIAELPSIEEFEKMAGELNDDALTGMQEQIDMETESQGQIQPQGTETESEPSTLSAVPASHLV